MKIAFGTFKDKGTLKLRELPFYAYKLETYRIRREQQEKNKETDAKRNIVENSFSLKSMSRACCMSFSEFKGDTEAGTQMSLILTAVKVYITFFS